VAGRTRVHDPARVLGSHLVWSATSQGASRSGGAGANPPTVEEPGVVSPEGRRATGVERARAHGRQARGRDEPRKARQGEWHRRAPQRWVVAAHGIARSQESRGCSHVTLKTGEICRQEHGVEGEGRHQRRRRGVVGSVARWIPRRVLRRRARSHGKKQGSRARCVRLAKKRGAKEQRKRRKGTERIKPGLLIPCRKLELGETPHTP
jgi:hypothetical protein